MRRREDPRLLRGEGRFLADLRIPGMLHAAFVRSPHAHALIRRIDASSARVVRGAVAVFTASDLPLCPITSALRDTRYFGGSWPPLATDRVRYVGETVAIVVAEDRYAAEDGIEAVEVEYDLLPAVTDARPRGGGARLHEDVPDNLFLIREHTQGDVAGAFADAPVVVSGTFRHQRVAGAPLEGRGVAAVWDARDGLTVWASTQNPHTLRTGLAKCLDLPEARVRVVVPDVGGAFGPKMHLYPEDVVICAAARGLRRPVSWVEDRRENLLTMTQARDVVIEASAAADQDGRIHGLRAEIVCDVGAYSVYPLTVALEPVTIAGILPGPYRIPAYAYTARAVATNKAPVGAYRGVGMGLGAWVMERLVDKVAVQTRLDPAEVRRRNFIGADEFPYTSSSGLTYDSGRYGDTLDRALRAFGYEEARHEQAAGRRQGRVTGIGISAFAEFTGMGSRTFIRRGMLDMRGYDSGTVKVAPGGSVRVHVSCPSQGQGHETAFAQLVAGELGIDPEMVVVAPVDTDSAGEGSGTFASRALVAGGGALIQAAGQVRAKAMHIAAHLLEARAEDVVVEDGRFFVQGAAARGVTWEEVARAAHFPAMGWLKDGQVAGLEATATYDPPPAAFGNGVHVALVDVDVETGEVKLRRYVVAEDCGTMLNPMIVEGQTHGGLAQGVGEALYEEVRHDTEGQPLATTFMDYILPTAMEMPALEVIHLETPSPNTFHGFKGVGESATIGAPGCIANAISDALRKDIDFLPVTPPRLLELLGPQRGSERETSERVTGT